MNLHSLAFTDTAPQPTPDRPASCGITALRKSGHVARLHGSSNDPLVSVLLSLSSVLHKRLVFFEDTAPEVSFDEAWLLNLFDAVRAGDKDRYCFALLSRMSKADAAEIHFAVCKAAWTLDAAA
ncbi:hypothetical protein [Roseobacter weihaiensis]|uniref:hypothetical protein n=1 Tax=Roseobacter weihaiensis TaxID=2763262 RepID=UPI001D0A70AB|nr:hypothetical protein [Roseobacter sp. H9]